MRTHIHKWGNSLALRIPQTYAREANVRQGSAIDLSLRGGKLVLTPVAHSSYSLKSLLSKITKGNLHKEQGFGKAQGKEKW